jgi:hypothetical protein
MAVITSQLTTELNTDPKSLGYAPFIAGGNIVQLAGLLNSLTGNGIGSVPREPISADAFIGLINDVELDTLTIGKKQDLQIYEGAGMVDIGNINVQNWIDNAFPAGSAPITHTAMHNMFNRVASRAEVLFGAGTVITTEDVSTALGHG